MPSGDETAPTDGVDHDSAADPRAVAHNEVVLRGRVASTVDERELPSGDTIVTARLIIDRDAAALTRSSQRVDTIDCVAWIRRVQRSMRGWQPGERVEITGAIRRRFFRSAQGPASRVEVEIRTAKRLDKPPRKKPG
jgi:single-strand DNA-binding protein